MCACVKVVCVGVMVCLCRRAYGKEIVDKEQPLLIHRPKRKARDQREEVRNVGVNDWT